MREILKLVGGNIRNSTFPLVAVGLIAISAPAAFAQWTQWGGANRDFSEPATKLSEQWPEGGPPVVWRRALGDGYSAILVDAERLFTMYRDGDDEIVIAMNAQNGETVWEYRYAAPLAAAAVTDFGKGPNATPLVVGDALITVGFNGTMHCLDKSTGKPRWSKELIAGEGGTFLEFGYSSSPLAVGDNVIVPVGGEGQTLVAYRVADGARVWAAGDFTNSYSSPITIELSGRRQVVIVLAEHVAGFDAESGRLLWSHPHVNQWKCNVPTPIWADGVLYISSFGESGSRALRLRSDGSSVSVEEIWAQPKMGVGQGNAVRLGDCVYGSQGSSRASFVSAIDMKTGEIRWKERGFGNANYIVVGDKLLFLDDAGVLALAKVTPEKLEVISRATLLKAKAWTAPTLVGSRLFLRDQHEILLVNLADG